MGDDAENMTVDQKKALKLRQQKIELMYKRDELDKRAAVIMKDREMHRKRREREALEKAASQPGDKGSRRIYYLGGKDPFEVDEEKDEELRKAKNRMIILNTPEIQDLKKQIDAAYVRQELLKQIEDKRNAFLTKMQLEREESEKFLKMEAEREEERKQQEAQKKLLYRQQLQDQIINKYKLKQIEYKNFLKERVLLEDSIRITLEEDQLELIRKKKLKENYKKEIENFHKAKALWIIREREIEKRNNKKLQEYIKSKEEFEQKCKEQEKMKKDLRDLKMDFVFKTLGRIQENDEEKRNELIRKYEEEAENKAREKETAEWLKKQRLNKELLDSFALALEDKLERLRREKLEDEKYMKEQMSRYHEDKKCLEMTDEKRRRLKMAYKSCILRDIEERKYKRKLEEEELIKMMEQEGNKRMELKRLINEERLKILQEHTGKLKGYLPMGTLKASDLPHLPEDVRDFYSGQTSKTECSNIKVPQNKVITQMNVPQDTSSKNDDLCISVPQTDDNVKLPLIQDNKDGLKEKPIC